MRIAVLAIAPLAARALVFRCCGRLGPLARPRRDPARPIAVVDTRTYRDVQHRIERLLEAGEARHARAHIHARCLSGRVNGQ